MSFLTPPLHTGEGWQGARNHILLVSMWFEVSKMNPCPRPTLPLWPVFDPKITHFWGVHSWCMAMAKNTSNQLGICPWKMHVRPMPKLSIFIAVTTKKRRKKTKKKTGKNGKILAKSAQDHHGTGDIFYQCLWLTKFCGKFGRSWIPRTARAPNSFIVLRDGVCERSQPLWKQYCSQFGANPITS